MFSFPRNYVPVARTDTRLPPLPKSERRVLTREENKTVLALRIGVSVAFWMISIVINLLVIMLYGAQGLIFYVMGVFTILSGIHIGHAVRSYKKAIRELDSDDSIVLEDSESEAKAESDVESENQVVAEDSTEVDNLEIKAETKAE